MVRCVSKAFRISYVQVCRTSIQKVRRRTYLSIGHDFAWTVDE
jgi:hypothetical protein